MHYPIEGVILRKNRIDDHRVVVSCFSREYGKIDIFAREKWGQVRFDILTHFTGQILTKEKNSLSQIYSFHPFCTQSRYDIYDIAGWWVSLLITLLPHGLPYPRLFQFLKAMLYNKQHEHNDWLLFLVQTCCDFGITSCNIEEYVADIQDPTNHMRIRADIESWIQAYRAS